MNINIQTQSPNAMYGAYQSGMNAMSFQLMAQMMQLMMGLMQMMFSHQAPMGMGHPGFGGQGASGGFGQGSSNFLGMPYGMNSGSGGYSGGSPSLGGQNGSSGAGSTSGARADVGNPQSAGNGYVKPLDGNFRISSGFGPRRAPTAGASTFHRGVDLAAPTGTPVRATKGGKVSISQHQTSNGKSTGYGNWIEIKHDDGTSSRYGHLNSRDVQVGQRIQPGQVIGTVGNTGTSTGAHLHFEVRNAQGQAVDPQKVMNF